MSKLAKITLICILPAVLVGYITTKHKSYDPDSRLVIFHAGSLTVPFKQICEEFNKHYSRMHPTNNVADSGNLEIICEAAGSRVCARKIISLNRSCDIIACADYTVIETLLINTTAPKYADWVIKFASNEMVIAFREDSFKADEINKDNWYDILLLKDITFGRSDPNADPCGYRSVLVMKLAEKFYNKPDLFKKMSAKNQKYIRPKETDLLSLLEMGELDYIFIYRSVAEQHNLKYIVLPDNINLKKAEFADFYKTASVRLAGKRPGTYVTKFGEPIIYGVSIPGNAPNRKLALAFLDYLLDADKGGAILKRNGQTSVVPSPTGTFDNIPESLKIFSLAPEQEDIK